MASKENSSPENDLRSYRDALGCFATGVAVVTAQIRGNPIALTINSFSSVSLEPPIILWSIGQDSTYYQDFLEIKRFTIHILAANQKSIADSFAKPKGDKFLRIDWCYDEHQVPLLKDSMTRFFCQTHSHKTIGDHRVIFGRVLAYSHTQESPLIFFGGRYLS